MVVQDYVPNKLKFLDGEDLYRYYMKLGKAGSINQLQAYATNKKWMNPDSGKPPTRMGVWSAMWRWALHNYDDAKELYADYVLEFGRELTDGMWNSLMESRAHQCLSPAGFRRFIGQHPELKPYAIKNRHMNE